MKFPGIALLDIRIGQKEYHPIHSEPISFMLGWPRYISFSFHIPSFVSRVIKSWKGKQFWFYQGWEPGPTGWDFEWFALKVTKGHMNTGRDENSPRV